MEYKAAGGLLAAALPSVGIPGTGHPWWAGLFSAERCV